MRVDDAIREFREQRALRRGRFPLVIPYTGYGSTSWVRVLGRVLITSQSPSESPQESFRGWRSFTGIPVDGAPVRVTIGDTVHHVVTNSGGVIDVRVEAQLTPGWHRILLQAEGVGERSAVAFARFMPPCPA